MQPTAEQLRQKEIEKNNKEESIKENMITNIRRSLVRRDSMVADEHEQHLKMILRHDSVALTVTEDLLVRSRAELLAWSNYGRPPTMKELRDAFIRQRAEKFQQEVEFWTKFIENREIDKFKAFRAEILDDANIFSEEKRKIWDDHKDGYEYEQQEEDDSDDDEEDEEDEEDDEDDIPPPPSQPDPKPVPDPEDDDTDEEDEEEKPYSPSPTVTPDPPPVKSATSQLLAPIGESQPIKKRPLLDITLPPDSPPFEFSFPENFQTPSPAPVKRVKTVHEYVESLVQMMKNNQLMTVNEFKKKNDSPAAIKIDFHVNVTTGLTETTHK